MGPQFSSSAGQYYFGIRAQAPPPPALCHVAHHGTDLSKVSSKKEQKNSTSFQTMKHATCASDLESFSFAKELHLLSKSARCKMCFWPGVVLFCKSLELHLLSKSATCNMCFWPGVFLSCNILELHLFSKSATCKMCFWPGVSLFCKSLELQLFSTPQTQIVALTLNLF